MAGTRLTGAILHGALVEGCSFRGADMIGARLQGCDLTKADATGAQFSRTVDTLASEVLRAILSHERSDERRVGKEGVSTCRSRCSPGHEKKKHNNMCTG